MQLIITTSVLYWPNLPLSAYFCSLVVHKEGFVLFIVSSLIYMLITCRLWKAIKKYSLSPEARNAELHNTDWNPSCYLQYFSPIQYYCFFLPYRMPSLTIGKYASYFSTYPSALWPDSFIGSTTCTVNQGVSIKSVWSLWISSVRVVKCA